MIYLLTEQVMNGTVTLDIISTGIEADSFDAAFEKVTRFENWGKAANILKNDELLSYTMPVKNGLQVWGLMKNKPLKVR